MVGRFFNGVKMSKDHDNKLARLATYMEQNPEKSVLITAETAPSFSERKEIMEEIKTQHFPSNFSFLSDAHGLRKGEITVVLGHKGHGKSTLNKAILGECVDNKKVCLCYLSEEKARQYLGTAFSGWGADRDEEIKKYIHGIGENDKLSSIKIENTETALKFMKALVHIEYNIKALKADILIFDNISTSSTYEENDKDAVALVFTHLRRLALRYGIPILMYSHVSGDLTFPYDVHNVRGNKTFINETENVFALYSRSVEIEGKKARRACIHWLAARFQGQVIDSYYLLSFNPSMLTFDSDVELSMSEFNSMFVEKKKTVVDEATLYEKVKKMEIKKLKKQQEDNQKYAESM